MWKSGLWVLVGLAAGIVSASAQQPKEAESPFNRANIVWVRTTARPDSVLTQLSWHLKGRGFMVDTLDAAHGILTTQVQVSAQTLPEQMKIRAIRVDDGWKLTGLYLIVGPLNSGATAFPAEFMGFDWSSAKSAFRAVEETARAIPQGRLRYGRGKVRFGVMTKLEDALKMPW